MEYVSALEGYYMKKKPSKILRLSAKMNKRMPKLLVLVHDSLLVDIYIEKRTLQYCEGKCFGKYVDELIKYA